MVKINEVKTPLYLAAEAGRADVLSWLLDQGVDVNLISELYRAELHMAARQASLQVVQALVGKGAQLNSQDKAGKNALISCC